MTGGLDTEHMIVGRPSPGKPAALDAQGVAPVASWLVRLPRLPGLVPAIVASCVLLPTAAAGAGTFGTSSPARPSSNSATFQDSTGEDALAPDITTIVVSNDDAGMVSFRVNIPNRA